MELRVVIISPVSRDISTTNQIEERYTPGSRGSGRVREFFDEARLKPMSSR
jgi:hypothetical protein